MGEEHVGCVHSQMKRRNHAPFRNVVYESECSQCSPPGTRREADKEGLEERRDRASLDVGETSRSVSERTLEH